MDPEPFFRRQGDAFMPQPICRGPWDPKSLHGRVIAGLLGAAIEVRFGDPAFQFARLTIDLWRLPGFVPLTVATKLLREGGRIKVAHAECFADGVSMGQATGVLLRKGAAPAGEIWSPPDWDFPKPEEIPLRELPADIPRDWAPMWETRDQGRSFGTVGPKRVWMREIRPLVDADPLTPFQRVALAADFSSPLAHSGSTGLAYINTDITVYLHRDPRGEWIGFDSTHHHASEGVAVGECMLYDEEGAIGRSMVAALAQKRTTG
ncbi:MAG: thioesterase family protein [Dehalococcoidia bacterium]